MKASGCKMQDAKKNHIQPSAFSPQPLERGFTLLEVLVAVAILGIAVTVVLQLFSANLRAISASEDYMSAAIKAEARLREILDEDNPSEKAWTETTDEGYRIEVAVSDAFKERTEKLQVRLLQIDLTIHWSKGPKEKSIVLSTMRTVKKQV